MNYTVVYVSPMGDSEKVKRKVFLGHLAEADVLKSESFGEMCVDFLEMGVSIDVFLDEYTGVKAMDDLKLVEYIENNVETVLASSDFVPVTEYRLDIEPLITSIV